MQDIPEYREGTLGVRAVLGWHCVCLFVCVLLQVQFPRTSTVEKSEDKWFVK
jgi:hypothetical protein